MINFIDNALYPELKRFPTRHDRDESLVRARRDAPLRKRVPVRLVIIAIGIIIALQVMDMVIPAQGPPWSSTPWLITNIAGALFFVGVVAMVCWHMTREVRKCLRAELSTQGIPTCIECGYDIGSEPGGQCPECGAAPMQEARGTA